MIICFTSSGRESIKYSEPSNFNFLLSFFDELSCCYFERFLMDFVIFRSARKRPTRLKHCKNQWIFMICLGARLRRRSGEGEEELQKRHRNNIENTKKNNYFSYFFRAGRPCSKNGSIMTSRRLSGTLPGTLWEPPGTPWEAHDDPKRRQERPQKAPGAAPGRPGESCYFCENSNFYD